MKRRDFVKAILATGVSGKALLAQQVQTPIAPSTPPPAPLANAVPPPPGPMPWMRGLMEVKPLDLHPIVADAVAQTTSHFFNPQQMATLHRLCEVLLPPCQGYPGALDAEAPEFLDFLIGASPVPHQQMYQAGLDRLESEAKQQFSLSFAAVDSSQADRLIRPWLRTWMTDHPPAEPYARFINLAHSDIRTATINSQAWSEAAKAAGKETPEMGLYWFPVDPDIHGKMAEMAAPPAQVRRSS